MELFTNSVVLTSMKTQLRGIIPIVVSMTALSIPLAAMGQEKPATPNTPSEQAPGLPHHKHHKGGPNGLGPSGHGPQKGPEGGPKGATPENPSAKK